jgi:hypothetical protein
MANGYGLKDRDSILGRVEVCLRHRVQTISCTHPTPSPMGTGVLLPGLKRPGRQFHY